MSVVSVRDQACAGHRNIYRHQTAHEVTLLWFVFSIHGLVISDYFQYTFRNNTSNPPGPSSMIKNTRRSFFCSLHLSLGSVHSNWWGLLYHLSLSFTQWRWKENCVGSLLRGAQPRNISKRSRPETCFSDIDRLSTCWGSCHQSILHLVRFK